jgi:hypothetical protein
MKKRYIIAVFSALACFALLPIAQAAPAPETPDPGAVGGSLNTADGANALAAVTTGFADSAFGWFALRSNIDGTFNTAVGAGTLVLNVGDQTTGDGLENTAVGAVALFLNTTGSNNTAVGAAALLNNADGSSNTAIGNDALHDNTGGVGHTAVGVSALQKNTSPGGIGANTAVGALALTNNTSGSDNTAVGLFALAGNQAGNLNTAIGAGAGINITGDGNVCIGLLGEAGVNDSTYIRNVNTTGQSFNPGTNNYVTVRMTDGRLGFTTIVSSQRYKEDIKPLDKTSEALFALKPVSFRLKKEYDETQALAFGLIAEEVEKVNPDLVYRNDKGQVESVRYEMVNAMLLNEFLKEHKKVEGQQSKIDQQQATIAELKSTVAQQQKGMEVLTVQLKEQAAQIQKVSAQLEVGKPATKVALGNQ